MPISFLPNNSILKCIEVNEDVIAGFLNHIKEIIANGNVEIYEYILNWYSYILQKPDGKTGTSINIGVNGAICGVNVDFVTIGI